MYKDDHFIQAVTNSNQEFDYCRSNIIPISNKKAQSLMRPYLG